MFVFRDVPLQSDLEYLAALFYPMFSFLFYLKARHVDAEGTFRHRSRRFSDRTRRSTFDTLKKTLRCSGNFWGSKYFDFRQLLRIQSGTPASVQPPPDFRTAIPAESGAGPYLRRRMNNELNFPPNCERLVLGCIDADFCK